jgi:hypothetical protein
MMTKRTDGIQGDQDERVLSWEADSLAANSLTATVERNTGMNGVLMRAGSSPLDQMAADTDPDRPIMGELVTAVTRFVDGVRKC